MIPEYEKYSGYTSVEQSRKLAEILSLESADMAWCNNSIRGVNYTDEYSANLYTVKEMQECFDEALNGWDKYWNLIPCWSLAALLGVLPSVIKRNDKRMFLTLEKAGAYNLYYKSPDRLDELWETDFEPIDACYKMIMDLHELELL